MIDCTKCHEFFNFTTLPPPLEKGMSPSHAPKERKTTGFLSKIEITGCTATITNINSDCSYSKKINQSSFKNKEIKSLIQAGA